MLTAITMLLILGSAVGICLLIGIRSLEEEDEEERLVPFAVLPIPDGNPDTKAFLERLGGQLSWMDASILQSVVLVYQTPEGETLCRNMAQQYDFFTCLSRTETAELIESIFQQKK